MDPLEEDEEEEEAGFWKKTKAPTDQPMGEREREREKTNKKLQEFCRVGSLSLIKDEEEKKEKHFHLPFFHIPTVVCTLKMGGEKVLLDLPS